MICHIQIYSYLCAIKSNTMKKQILTIAFALLAIAGFAQQKCYWVFLTDKNDTQFDPYTYFDAKAIERYQKCGADLYDISNYPLNDSYVNAVAAYANEMVGESRWLNALGIMATDDNINAISQMPFVSYVQEIASEGSVAEYKKTDITGENKDVLTDQLKRFEGQKFINKGINGKGIRICVLDAGFPGVDTHPAFQHLRDNHQIIKTYNFPKKQENVYGWGTHGTMVLSCIAGMIEDQQLGLATGAEFLLGRTEIDPEPFKEEIWWAQGAEWADKNGADIINSSLGYGKDRHYTKDMDGTSYVAKAANKAVEKGILVCNSAGNEGDDSRWRTIITPSDAENVLCVGGINADLVSYRHISFSSYGPSADGRMKPNVCAFGQATVANPSGGYESAFGTSFSSPLTAGFCACAWQTRRDLTALQLKAEIEKSGDLYPYYDYAFGYGVPQAGYFIKERKVTPRNFVFVEDENAIRIHFTNKVPLDSTEIIMDEIFINYEGENGILNGYYQLLIADQEDIVIDKNRLANTKKINVSYKGFYDSYEVKGNQALAIGAPVSEGNAYIGIERNATHYKAQQENWASKFFMQYDYNLPTDYWDGYSRHYAFGKRWMYGKTYKIGMGLSADFYRFRAKDVPPTEDGINHTTAIRSMQIRGEVFQRIVNRMWGMNWDLGVYGSLAATRKAKDIMTNTPDEWPYNDRVVTKYTGYKDMNWYQYGVTTRISKSFSSGIGLSVYGNYRLSDIFNVPTPEPSPWSVGLELEIGL